jgi:hypothetical protein
MTFLDAPEGERLKSEGQQLALDWARTKARMSWSSMRHRCENSKSENFARYGGRGIKVCRAWASFEAFYADVGPPPRGAYLDRIDNDGNYEPGNVRWVDAKTSARNRRSSRIVEALGRKRSLIEWAEETGIPKTTLRERLEHGWPADQAVTAPVRPKAKNGCALPRSYRRKPALEPT